MEETMDCVLGSISIHPAERAAFPSVWTSAYHIRSESHSTRDM